MSQRTQDELAMYGQILANGIDQLTDAAASLPDWAEPEEWSCEFTLKATGETWTIIVRPGEKP